MNTQGTETAPRRAISAGAVRAFIGGRWVIAFLILETLYFCLRTEGFANLNSAQILLFYGVQVFLLAVAELFVIVTGGIDLSVGYVLGFASIVSIKLIVFLTGTGMPAPMALLIGVLVTLLIGLVPGLINGWLVAYLGVPPFIATFSMLGVCHGVSELLINGIYAMGLPQLAADIGNGRFFYLAPGAPLSFFSRPEVERGVRVLEV
ncbi:MAG TPA: hypothetical protein VFL04_01690, partial [Rectinemataceae bacterium]|nr:hypothetical protein [Rectinemataceae bacterium]